MAVSHKYIKYAYEAEIYTPEGAKQLSSRQLSTEYSRLRSVARKRLERFEGTEYTDSQVYKLNVGKYKPVKELSDTDMRYLLGDLRRFLSSEQSSVAGLRAMDRDQLRTLHEHGYNISAKQLPEFRDFMAYERMRSGGKDYDSDRTAMFYTVNKGLKPDKLRDAWNEYKEQLYNGEGYQNEKPKRSGVVRRKLGIK